MNLGRNLLSIIVTVSLFAGTIPLSPTAETITLSTIEERKEYDYSFVTTDDEQLTTKEGERATIAVFGCHTCYNTRSILTDLSDEEWIKSDSIEIIFQDIKYNSKETVAQFQNEINCPYISFCYDETTYSNSYMWSLIYESGANSGSSVSLPVIAYFDDEGVLCACSTGYVTAETVKETLDSDVMIKYAGEFVERLYTTLLGRSSDAKGKANHVNSLKSGKTAAEIGAKFVLSTELKNKKLTNREFVKRMYQTFLDRTPSSNEITRWAKTLDNGCTYEYILGRFVASAEFKKLATNYGITAGTYTPTQNRDQNENVTAFVSRMFTKALKRNYDVTGLNNHTGRILNKTHTPAQIAKLFFFSTELKNKNLSDEEFVTRLYNALFDRNPDAKGKANWLTKMKNGYTREKVFDGFAASAEFKNLVASFGL